MNRIVFALTIFLSGCFFETASAHPGGLNAEGCHNNRKTGEYHCHGESKRSPPKEIVTAVDAPALAKPEIVRNEGDLLRLGYEGFTLWLDCSKRGLVKYRFNVQRDTGNVKRNNDFYLDPNVPPECQQKSTKAYGHGYDRGHSGPNANALDYSELAIKQTNYSIDEIERITGERIPVADYAKHDKPTVS